MRLLGLLKSKLLKETAIYSFTNAFYTGLPLILMPFLVAVMKPEDYGIMEIFRSLTLILIPIMGLSTVQALSRFYYDLDSVQYQKLLFSVVLFQFLNAIILSIFIAAISAFLESKYIVIAFLAVVFCLFSQVTECLLITYRVNRKPFNFMILRLITIFLDLGLLTLFYFLYTEYDWTYRVIPNVIAITIIGFVSLFLIFKRNYFKFSFDSVLLKDAIIFSSPLIIHMLSGFIMSLSDRFLIAHFLGEKAVGNYSVAYQLGLSISFFYSSFNLAWTPTFYEYMKADDMRRIRLVKKYITIALLVLGVMLIGGWLILSKYINNFGSYDIPLSMVVLIIVAYIINSFYKFNANFYFYHKDTKKLSILTLISAVSSICLNLIFIPYFGILGAAYTTLLSFSIMYLLVYYFKRPQDAESE